MSVDAARALLCVPDLDAFAQGKELVCTLGDPRVFEALLEDENFPWLGGGSQGRAAFARAVLVSAGAAISDALATMASAYTELVIKEDELDLVVDFSELTALTNLSRVRVQTAGVANLEATRAMRLTSAVFRVKRPVKLNAFADSALAEVNIEAPEVESIQFLASCPLQSLSVVAYAQPTIDLRFLEGSETLQELFFSRATLPDLLPALRSLSGETNRWRGFPRMPELESMSLLRVMGLRNLDGLTERAPALRRLTLRNCPELESLDGAADHPSLKEILLRAAPAFVRIGRLPEGVRMPHVELQSSGLRNLQGIEHCGPDVAAPASLETLDGIERHAIRLLDLRGCHSLRDVSALTGSTSVRAILVHNSSLDPSAFPADVQWAVSTEQFPNTQALVGRLPPSALE